MILDSSRLGKITVDEQEIITFPTGIPGFEELKTYAIVTPDPDLPLSYLQSVENPELSFIIVDPFLFEPSYEFILSETAKEELKASLEQDIVVWSIVSVRDDFKNATHNLLAPLVINMKERLGKQVILQNTPYKTRHRLFAANG
ncbi:flagellar assembly protein FliW [Paenibacillus sp. OAS669]|uniref:flagellar assembly protein FliW n=1 Tax=Paenibacillus sp. OAS669 TaxID=2663821 RepID=UPI00178BB37D|nr:flagellar assembly protein FliW [Paenibacillus sp. OAS669]MBE1447431.1 flagellar assembly factor FliW [Paenibacillus sp. OAS669]